MPDREPLAPLWSPSSPLLAGIVTATPDFLASASCFITWLNPTVLGQRMVAHLVLVMLLEFIVVHSAGFIGVVIVGDTAKGKKILALIGLGALYSLFTGAFALGEHTWWPFTTFWILILNRIMSVLISPTDDVRAFPVVMITWAVGAALYLAFAALTSALPIPALGITPDVIAAQGFHLSGLWVDEPWRPIAFGAFYFFAFGVAELLIAYRAAAPAKARRFGFA